MEDSGKELDQMAKKDITQPCGCTTEGDPIKYNPWNKAVQCHKCGAQYILVASNNWFNLTRRGRMDSRELAKKLLQEVDAVDGYWEEYDSEAIPIVLKYFATARAEALREDVAGKVWELVFPHLKEGGKCKLYDEMRRMYPAPPAILADEPKEERGAEVGEDGRDE